ncbi:MAG: hypothetical protein AAFR77_00815 [Cyanobacteria bacterium J06631_2]
MRKTKMIKVYLPHRQFWIFSFTVNLLVLAIQAPSLLAQANNQPAKLQTANNPAIADLEPKILSEINRVRTNPQGYAQWLEQQRQYYDGIWLRLPGEKPVRTNKGKKALEEAIAFLKEQQPLSPLKSSEQTAASAKTELANFANAKNIQYFSYGRKTATGIVMGLVIDELFPDRRRRQSLLSPDASGSGVVCKPDPRYAKVCAIAYSDSSDTDSIRNTDVAIAKPEVPAPAKPEPPVAELPETKPPEVIVPDPEPAPEPQQAAEKPAQVEEEQLATLPVPPQPQAPPTPTVSSQPEPEPEPEPKPEPQATVEAEDEVSQAEIESEIAEIVEENEPEEVAINLENSGFSEKVEKGALEEGDRVIADDGSLYDFYPIQGKKGDSFTIYLESDEFDANVIIFINSFTISIYQRHKSIKLITF